MISKKERSAIYYTENKEAIALKQKEYYQKNKDKLKEQSKIYHADHKENISIKRKNKREAILPVQKKWIEQNKDKVKQHNQVYYLKNKDKINKRDRNVEKALYHKKRKATDPLYKLKSNIRTLIYMSLVKQGYGKTSKTYRILGCTFEEFKLHIEQKFKDGMSWNNSGLWHLDHIKPISLALSENEAIQLNHYSNFQPLWADDNYKKSNKYEEVIS